MGNASAPTDEIERYQSDYVSDQQRETDFNVNDLNTFSGISLPKLVPEQRIIYDTIM